MLPDTDGSITPAHDRQDRHPRAWLSVGILFLLVTLSYVDRMAIVLMVEPVKRDLGISDLQISYLQGLAYALCFALAGPPLAWVADRYSRHQVIFWGVAIWSLATMASGLTADYHQLLRARFMVGIGEAALMPAAFSLLSDLFPRRQQGIAFGIIASGASVGGAVALGGGGALMQWANDFGTIYLPVIGEVRPWQLVFLLAGAPGIFAALLIFLVPNEMPHVGSASQGTHSYTLIDWLRENTAFAIVFSIIVGVLCALAYGITNWTPTFFIRTYGLKLTDFTLWLAGIQLTAGLCGYIGGGYLIDRLARGRTNNPPYLYLSGVLIALLIAGVGAFGLRAGPGISLAFLALFHLVLPYTGIVAAELNLTSSRLARSQVIAAVTAVYTLSGMIIGPSSVAYLTDRVFQDPGRLADGLVIVTVVYCPLALGLLLLSRRSAARAIASATRRDAAVS